MDGVPVELRVATIFWAITALLPIPLITTRPLHPAIAFTAFSKSSLIKAVSPAIEWASSSMVLSAVFLMESGIFGVRLRQGFGGQGGKFIGFKREVPLKPTFPDNLTLSGPPNPHSFVNSRPLLK